MLIIENNLRDGALLWRSMLSGRSMVVNRRLGGRCGSWRWGSWSRRRRRIHGELLTQGEIFIFQLLNALQGIVNLLMKLLDIGA